VLVMRSCMRLATILLAPRTFPEQRRRCRRSLINVLADAGLPARERSLVALARRRGAAAQAANVLVHTDGRVVLSDFGVTATLERHEDAAGAPQACVPDRLSCREQGLALWCAMHRSTYQHPGLRGAGLRIGSHAGRKLLDWVQCLGLGCAMHGASASAQG